MGQKKIRTRILILIPDNSELLDVHTSVGMVGSKVQQRGKLPYSAIMIVRSLWLPLCVIFAAPLALARSPPHASQQQQLGFGLDWVRRSYEHPRVGQVCGSGSRGAAGASAVAAVAAAAIDKVRGGGRRELTAAAVAAAAAGGKGPCVGLIGILSHP